MTRSGSRSSGPGSSPRRGPTDEAAVARYRAILGACHDRGLTPLVTLHHFTHPWWLGEDLWLRPDAPERFARWVRFAVEAFGDRCDKWVTVNEANVLAIQTYLLGSFPPGRVGAVSKMADALDHLVAAHVLGYEAIHARQPGATVATNNFSLSVYELDRLALDLLVARAHGVGRDGLVDWLAGRRAEHYRRVPDPALPGRGGLERALRAAAARALPLGRTLPAATAAVFDAGFDRLVDVAQLDFYVPAAADHFALPGRPSAGGRSWSVARDLWEDRPDPVGLVRYLEAATEPGLEVWVVENGMCNLVRRGRSYPRTDHWTQGPVPRREPGRCGRRRGRRGAGHRLLALDPGRQLRMGHLRAALRPLRGRPRAGQRHGDSRRHGGRRGGRLPRVDLGVAGG